MKNHLNSTCKPWAAIERARASGQDPRIASFFNAQASHTDITKEALEEQILKFFVSGNIPFAQADNPQFRSLISMIKINKEPAHAPSRTTLRTRLTKYSQMSTDNLKMILAGNTSKISLALDCWTSRNQRGFLGLLHLET
jgi:hypothetical protein